MEGKFQQTPSLLSLLLLRSGFHSVGVLKKVFILSILTSGGFDRNGQHRKFKMVSESINREFEFREKRLSVEKNTYHQKYTGRVPPE